MNSFEIEFKPQYAMPLVDQIVDFLTDAIIERRLQDGQRLVENDLQRRFGVSRGPIREAFRVLEKNGLVHIIPRKGTYIRKISQKDIEEIFPVLAYLESLAARAAIPHITAVDVENMEVALSRMAEAAKGNDLKSYLKFHLAFHKIFIRACKNDVLIETIERLRRQAVWFRFSYLYIDDSFEYSISVHRKILELFGKKDADQVEVLVKEHLLVALPRFIRLLELKKQDLKDGGQVAKV
jgi:DNA-binding GntR family transcriptional regulator